MTLVALFYMKIVCISDTHGQRVKDLPKADILIHSGDWSGSGTFRDTNDFLVWMSSVRNNYKKVICVPGNHDKWIEANIDQAKDEFMKLRIELLINEETWHDNLLFYGYPYTPEFGNWAFNSNDIERADYCDAIPKHTNVLISHGPPKGTMDTLAANGSNPGETVGCQFLRNTVTALKPTLHVFGHIHEGGGITNENGTLFVNASCMDEYYRLVNGFKVIYL